MRAHTHKQTDKITRTVQSLHWSLWQSDFELEAILSFILRPFLKKKERKTAVLVT